MSDKKTKKVTLQELIDETKVKLMDKITNRDGSYDIDIMVDVLTKLYDLENRYLN